MNAKKEHTSNPKKTRKVIPYSEFLEAQRKRKYGDRRKELKAKNFRKDFYFGPDEY
jgi:hypothetical protein